MSVSFSDIVAAAIVDAVAAPGMEGRRFLFTGLWGASPHEVFEALAARFDEELPLSPDDALTVQGMGLPGSAGIVLPYLVSEDPPHRTNSGSYRFAGTLRTHFLDAGPDRGLRLLVLDERPIETVLTASEDVAALPQLQWKELLIRTVQMATRTEEPNRAPALHHVREAFAEMAPHSGDSVRRLADFASDLRDASTAEIGRRAYETGVFVSDPDLSTASARARLALSARWRARLDGWHDSAAHTFSSEVRTYLEKRKVPESIIERVAGSTGPRGIDYSAFTLGELESTGAEAPPLRLDGGHPVQTGLRAARLDGRCLVAWSAAAGTTLVLALSRPAEAGDSIRWVWADGSQARTELKEESDAATVQLAPEGRGPWRFGRLEIRTSREGRTFVSQRLSVAAYFGTTTWMPVEAGIHVDAAAEAFAVEHDPRIIAVGDGGLELGEASIGAMPATEADGDRVDLPATYNGTTAQIPVLLLGDPPDEPDDGVGVSFPSIQHAMLELGLADWPAARLREDGTVAFSAGGATQEIARPQPAGIDGSALERAILSHPEWLAYEWDPPSRQLKRSRAVDVAGHALDGDRLERFMAARRDLFSAAAAAGSISALNPSDPSVAAYVESYRGLVRHVSESARYRSDFDRIVLCDAVGLSGRRDFLVAPTSPLTVAFHEEFGRRVDGWNADGSRPRAVDLSTISLRHAVPVVHAFNGWNESAPTDGLLWRHYVPASGSAAGALDRNASFIGARIRFFLDVHSLYLNPDQTIAVAFVQPASAAVVLDALKEFYRPDRRRERYTLPRLEVHILGAVDDLRQAIREEVASRQPDDLDRLVHSRVTILYGAARDDGGELPFVHVAFMFRSPGERGTRPVPMGQRPPTTYAGGLASTPGRILLDDADPVFASGTFARPPAAAHSQFEYLQAALLEIVGGQPVERIEKGWTRMVTTTVRQRQLGPWYDRAVWVVHLDRLMGVEAFSRAIEGQQRYLIDYEEHADPAEPGYDGITATTHVRPYFEAIRRALTLGREPGDDRIYELLRLLQAVSGRWAMQILKPDRNAVVERIGFFAAIAALDGMLDTVGTRDGRVTVLLPLDELVRGKGHLGVPRPPELAPRTGEPMCDDILALSLPLSGEPPVTLRGAVVEVKWVGPSQVPPLQAAGGQVERTTEWLSDVFNCDRAGRPFRARQLTELIHAGTARMATFGLGSFTPAVGAEALDAVAAGDYELDLRHWRGGTEHRGLVITLETGSEAAASQSSAGSGPVDRLRLGRPFLNDLLDGEPMARGSVDPISFEAPSGGRVQDQPPTPPTEGARSSPERVEAGTAAPSARGAWGIDAREVAAAARSLDRATEKYGLSTEPFEPDLAQVGPNIVRYRTRPLGRLSVGDFEKRARDLGREIGAPHAVIIDQDPPYITVDVPRRERSQVPITAVSDAIARPSAPGALDIIVGVAPSGDVRAADLARLPHLLVAGATGSGKSVFLRGLVSALAGSRSPDSLDIMIIDPKRLDFAPFRTMPHLRGRPIISDPREAMEWLSDAITSEVDRRQPILESAGVTSATEFYERGGSLEDLRQMVIVVDEFADLVGVLEGTERRGFHELIQRYAQLTRAYGIYLVLATQRPDVNVITGNIKANLTARIAFSLPSHRDSMTVLDRPGAEDLLGNGDLLFYHAGRIERLQAPMTTLDDVRTALERQGRTTG